ncbi:MAG: ABC transporter permease [Spirochaetaceae bacterium]|nr:MAG: ABC transporter permease [Spirochaetaceae bacterium]
MMRYALHRALLIVPTTVAASLVVFLAMRALPGDVALAILADTPHTIEVREALREELGLNKPLSVQYADWALSMVTGDFGGRSLESREPIRAILARQFPVTALLALYAVAVSIVVGLPLGVVGALRRGRPADRIVELATTGGLSLPIVFTSLLTLWLLLRLFGWSPPIIYSSPTEDLREHVEIMLAPALLLSLPYGAQLARVMRSALVAVADADYTVAARSRGLSELSVVVRHGVPNALLPAVTMIGLQFGTIVSGALVVETVFGLPGIGRGVVHAALARDYPVVQSTVIVLVTLVLATNLIVDLVYTRLDPRVASTGSRR